MKQYCSTLLPYVSGQPVKIEQLPAAIFEANALYCARAHSNEIEWSRQATAAQRSRQVSVFVINSLLFCSVCKQFVFSSTPVDKNLYLGEFSVLQIYTTTTPQPFYGPFSRTTRVSRCQKRTSGLHGARED